MEGGLLLDVVVSQGATILQLLPGEDQTLLVWWDPFLVLNFGLYVVDGVGTLHLESYGLTSQGLNEDLHLHRHTQPTDESKTNQHKNLN
ncbi:hypothetical protein VIGAN_10244500 [Vigna angularis var. angularis]|uniref:Uncharacterized protein n=1 Tax=Vigna angularis var. angularis TaxID=157739 RepID=A0A0S3T6Y5_PHAAN|nr:hypothetical protein VIGAN_10244500 [Vigna angularis var. angularis]